MKQIEAYFHTSIDPKQSLGAWSFVLTEKGRVLIECWSGHGSNSHRKAELEAVSKAIVEAGKQGASSIVIHGATRTITDPFRKWLKGWVIKGWKNHDGEDVPDAESWRKILEHYDKTTFKPSPPTSKALDIARRHVKAVVSQQVGTRRPISITTVASQH